MTIPSEAPGIWGGVTVNRAHQLHLPLSYSRSCLQAVGDRWETTVTTQSLLATVAIIQTVHKAHDAQGGALPLPPQQGSTLIYNPSPH